MVNGWLPPIRNLQNIYDPRPEERAPELVEGVRVSKDGHRRGPRPWPSFAPWQAQDGRAERGLLRM